jgi:hypothetical protein
MLCSDHSTRKQLATSAAAGQSHGKHGRDVSAYFVDQAAPKNIKITAIFRPQGKGVRLE